MTLTEVSGYVRKYLPHAVLAGIVLLIIYYLIQISVLLFFPAKNKVTLDPKFGVISRPFIKDASNSAGLKFTLDTVEGTPITATESARVYFLPPSPAKFGYRENVFVIAQNLGIDTQNAKYRLINKDATFETDLQKLSVDIGNFNFNFQYLFEKQPERLNSYTTPTSEEAQVESVAFLQSIGKYPEEFTSGETQPIYFKFDTNEKTLKQVSRNAEANLIEIDFFRPKPEDYPIVTPKFPNSQNYVTGFFDSEGQFHVLNAQIAYFPKSEEQVGVYPLKNGRQAFDALKKGNALVVSNPKNKKDVVIKKMFFAYFDPDTYQDYFQPVYVFIGEDFVAYVPAVSDEYLAK